MEEAIEEDVDSTIGKDSSGKQGKKREKIVDGEKESLPRAFMEDRNDEAPPGVKVSVFDYLVENHFRAMDMISKLCGESECECDESEIQRLSSSITFLREWRHFCYQPRSVTFACQSEAPQGKDVIGALNLPQFSAATVPKKDGPNGDKISSELSKDFIMYVGGLVWALDWCPRVHQTPDSDIKIEFIAVAAHPPESSYHKIGAPLTGRGVIQIWCLLNVGMKDKDVLPQVKEKPKRNCRSTRGIKLEANQPKKPRGRPRKKPINDSVDNLDGDYQCLQALAVQFPDDPSKLLPTYGISQDTLELLAKEDIARNWSGSSVGVSAKPQQNPRNSGTVNVKLCQPQKPRGRPRKKPIKESVDNLDGGNQSLRAPAVEFPEDSSKLLPTDRFFPEQVTKEDTGKNQNGTREEVSAEPQQQNPSGTETINVQSSWPQKPGGKPRKKPINEYVDNLDCSNQYVQALSVQVPEDSSKILPADDVSNKAHVQVTEKDSSRTRKGSNQGVSENLMFTASMPRRMKDKGRTSGLFDGTGRLLLTQTGETSLVNPETSSSCGQDPVGSSENIAHSDSFEINPHRYSVPEDVALPRVALCLAHNGKVAWDVKWRPSDSYNKFEHKMGYLAVLLGNGALEVWDVPLPRATKVIYSACQKEGTDPRFVKLEPVFKCSMLKCGDRKSIPLTVEWSASSPHDLILAGCHDGVVALWKFAVNGPSKDTRPLLCFSADTVPIRALAWAPVESDPESANVIVTAGHKGIKFWDIRDPFRPLWDLNPGQRIVYSLDWLPDPRCVILSFDDGELRILSLLKAANDVPVTGKPFVGTQQQGLHSYYCSSSAIWSVQVSRLTGMVAYCSADGTVLRFQLTTREVEKDPLRNRAPHFLCGSLTEEESALTVISPLPEIPFPMKKSLNKTGNAPRTKRGFLAVSNQEKRAKEQMEKGRTSEDQPLALCYGDDPGSEFQSDDMLMTQKSKQKLTTKSSSKKKLKTDQALICRDVDPKNLEREEESGNENEIEELPPKIIAMNRVRWNMNKGSERWLCYGGAGGIIRCQEISIPRA